MEGWRFRRTGNEINDGIDPVFEYPPYILELLDTAEVQRMHTVVQTGFSSWPYPNLQHTRKVHLIGTAKNAIRMWEAAVANGPARMGKESIDTYRAIIASAGLLHDIGHSPYSHDLEGLMKACTGKSHEQIAAEMIVGEYSLLQFYEDVPSEIVPQQEKEAICRTLKRIPSLPSVLENYCIPAETIAQIIDKKRAKNVLVGDKIGRNHFLCESIDGAMIDADKLDYLERDAQNAGITEARFKPASIVDRLGLVEGDDGLHFAIADNGIEMLSQLVFTRGYMFQMVYRHKTALKVQAMIIEACKRFLKSLEQKWAGREYGKWLHLLDDAQFQRFMTSYSSEDPIATDLFFRAKYNRREKYAIAYQIESKHIPQPIDAFENEESGKLQALLRIIQQEQKAPFSFPEDSIREELLARVNSGRGKRVRDYEVIVFFDKAYIRDILTKDALLEKFKLFVYDHRNPETVYLTSERLQNQNAYDTHLDHLFQTFCQHRTPKYFFVLCPKEHVEKVNKATEAYVQELLRKI